MRKLIVVGMLTVTFTACMMVGLLAYPLFYRPMPIDANTSLVLPLDKNTSASTFVQQLHARKWIASPRLLLLYIRLNGLTHQLRAGVYAVKPPETALAFLNRVMRGDVLRLPFRITEGATQRDVVRELLNASYLTYQSDDWILISTGHSSAEGLLLADTYYYDAGSQAALLLKMAHQNLEQSLNALWANRTPNLPYKTPYEMLIAASIIEKEAAHPDERRLISGVIVNRLKKRMPLQMDPTVIYALGDQFQVTLSHLNLSVDSPYNTYKHYGLPPTPIAMIGKDSLDAAAHPTVSQYLYFVARGDGTHQFSESYLQQRQAVKTFMQHDKTGKEDTGNSK